jgi:hypothetical protein
MVEQARLGDGIVDVVSVGDMRLVPFPGNENELSARFNALLILLGSELCVEK